MATSIPSARSRFGDTTFTKIFVGGLAWETQSGGLQKHFEQFGEILEAAVIIDKRTERSKGYGFLTLEAFTREASKCLSRTGECHLICNYFLTATNKEFCIIHTGMSHTEMSICIRMDMVHQSHMVDIITLRYSQEILIQIHMFLHLYNQIIFLYLGVDSIHNKEDMCLINLYLILVCGMLTL